MTRKRCAIYTRKSTEEGLDQAFNSLDAQRDACVSSQKQEGWIVVRKDYDDGGYSGGNIERPGLQRLLEDIKSGLVDVVVVYKIDRLTRSLADFAKMVELFDAKGVSFVSVTQQFNTTTSMGRLTLNVLLSFAQFEREVTAERIRDKVAASKKKGLWIGGAPPLGYDVKDKTLVVNEQETKDVRRIFEAYLELGSTRALCNWAKDNCICTKVRRRPDGSIRCGGRPFSRGNLHALLSYHAYVGEVRFRDNVYPGVHQPLMSRELWDQVQAKLAKTKETRHREAQPKRPLARLLFDDTGDKLITSYAMKQKRRYNYYISKRLSDGLDPSGWRLSVRTIEDAVTTGLIRYLSNPKHPVEILRAIHPERQPDAIFSGQIGIAVDAFLVNLENLPGSSQLAALVPFMERIDIAAGELIIHVKPRTLARILDLKVAERNAEPNSPGQRDSVDASSNSAFEPQTEPNHLIHLPFTLRRRGVESHLILTTDSQSDVRPDLHLVKTIARARVWFDALRANSIPSINAIAARYALPASEVSRQLPLAFFSPKIVSEILRGHQPVELTTKRLTRLGDLPLDWNDQARVLGFNDLLS